LFGLPRLGCYINRVIRNKNKIKNKMKNSTKTLQDATVQMFKDQQNHIELLTEKLNLLQDLVDTYKNALEKRDAYIKSLEELVANLVTTSKNILHNSENIVNIKKEETVREVLK
jgi:uncharacterized protein YoxC